MLSLLPSYFNHMRRNPPEDTEPMGTDLRDVPPEARATRPDLAAAAGVERNRQAALERSRRRLMESITPPSGASRKTEVIARICLYNLDQFHYRSEPEQIMIRRMSSTGAGETYIELKFSGLSATYVYCKRGCKKALAGTAYGPLLEDADDVTALYHVRTNGILREIHRWEDEKE